MSSRKLALPVLLLAATALVASPGTGRGQPAARITFDRYHTVAQIEAYLRAVTQRYPDLAELVEIGRSLMPQSMGETGITGLPYAYRTEVWRRFSRII